jgi:hypothetical protein
MQRYVPADTSLPAGTGLAMNAVLPVRARAKRAAALERSTLSSPQRFGQGRTSECGPKRSYSDDREARARRFEPGVRVGRRRPRLGEKKPMSRLGLRISPSPLFRVESARFRRALSRNGQGSNSVAASCERTLSWPLFNTGHAPVHSRRRRSMQHDPALDVRPPARRIPWRRGRSRMFLDLPLDRFGLAHALGPRAD